MCSRRSTMITSDRPSTLRQSPTSSSSTSLLRFAPNVPERRLFRGLSDGWQTVRRIAGHNFEPRSNDGRHGNEQTLYDGRHGTGFSASAGRGSHHGHAATRPDAATGLRYIVLARVLVGRSVACRPLLYGSPPPTSTCADCQDASYDSFVDDPNKPTEFVVFNRCQIYPEHVIVYSDVPPIGTRSSCVIL
jgi:hypothetical protein